MNDSSTFPGFSNSAVSGYFSSVSDNPYAPTDFGASTAGDLFSGQYGSKEQASRQSQLDYEQWLRNEYSAKQQRAFEEYMSNTQVQRAMKDIEAAGLNPWLALQSAGFGGAVPTGASATSAAGQAASQGSNTLASVGTAALGIAALIKIIAQVIK